MARRVSRVAVPMCGKPRKFGSVTTCREPSDIPDLLAGTAFDAVLLDMNFGPGESSGEQGLYWLEQILLTYDKAHPRASLSLGALLAPSKKERKRAKKLLRQALKSPDEAVQKRAKALLGKL